MKLSNRMAGSTNHERPIILKPHPVNTTAQPGEKTSLQCKIRSLVPPTVKWIKRLDPSQGETFKANWPNNSLRIDGKLYLILPPQQVTTPVLDLFVVFFFILS